MTATPDVHDLIEMIESGIPTRRIWAQTGLTRGQFHKRLKRAGLGIRDIRGSLMQVRSATAVGQLFGVDVGVVGNWIRFRLLAAQRAPVLPSRKRKTRRGGRVGNRTHMHITDSALMDFLALRKSWVCWEPAQITDPDWRSEAERLRAAATGHWEQANLLSRQLGYSDGVVAAWIDRGVWPVETTTYGPYRYVWVPNRGLPPPPKRKRPGTLHTYPRAKVCRICESTFFVDSSREYHKRVTCSDTCQEAQRHAPRQRYTWPIPMTCIACGVVWEAVRVEDLRRKSCGAAACVGTLRGRKPKVRS